MTIPFTMVLTLTAIALFLLAAMGMDYRNFEVGWLGLATLSGAFLIGFGNINKPKKEKQE